MIFFQTVYGIGGPQYAVGPRTAGQPYGSGWVGPGRHLSPANYGPGQPRSASGPGGYCPSGAGPGPGPGNCYVMPVDSGRPGAAYNAQFIANQGGYMAVS